MDSLQSTYKYYTTLEIIKNSSRVLVLTHRDPDGDAVASTCAVSLLLDRLKKSYQLFAPTPPSTNFLFLTNMEKITSDPDDIDFYGYDLIIILDCGSITRTDMAYYIENKQPHQTILEFDHHPREERKYSDLEIRLTQAAATSEVLYYFFYKNGIKINKNLAECILTGILTDTANFMHSSATKNTIDIASHMMNKGAPFTKITKHVWQNKSLNSVKLWSRVLNNLKINPKYNIAFTVLTKKDLDKFRENEDDITAIANNLNNLKGVKAVIFLRQEKENMIKGSLRAVHPDVNVAKLANFLGGGGHVKAAGFSLEGKIKKTRNGWKIK